MTYRAHVLLVLGLSLTSSFRIAATSQVVGVVVDSSGAPVSGALVDLWDPLQRLGTTTTDLAGHFRIVRKTAPGRLGILVREMGYQPLRIDITTAGDTSLRLVLSSVPLTLPAVAVTSEGNACPHPDDPRALKTWRMLARRYSGNSMIGAWSDSRMSMTIVPATGIGSVDTGSLRPSEIGEAAGPLMAARDRIRQSGYAYPVTGLSMGAIFDYWEYPPLESFLASHFVEPLFGERHTLHFAEGSGGQVTIVFCPRSLRHPEIAGALTIGPDSSLLRVTWRYVTPTHDEGAGGEVLFAPIDTVVLPRYLLPIAGLFWRARAVDYLQIWSEHTRWHLCGGLPLDICRKRSPESPNPVNDTVRHE